MRKLVLIVALISAVSFGFGWITEDLCCVGGSFADDPNTPIVAAEYALPAHLQGASKAALTTVSVAAAAANPAQAAVEAVFLEAQPTGLSSLQSPRRC